MEFSNSPEPAGTVKSESKKRSGLVANPDTFATFVAGLRSDDKRHAEFASVFKALPADKSLDSWGALRLFLKSEGASDEAIVGARAAWRSFRRRFRT